MAELTQDRRGDDPRLRSRNRTTTKQGGSLSSNGEDCSQQGKDGWRTMEHPRSPSREPVHQHLTLLETQSTMPCTQENEQSSSELVNTLLEEQLQLSGRLLRQFEQIYKLERVVEQLAHRDHQLQLQQRGERKRHQRPRQFERTRRATHGNTRTNNNISEGTEQNHYYGTEASPISPLC